MSEWELLDVMHGYMNMAVGSFNAYLTIIFGFLAASYLVAHRLKKVEILIISGLFIFGALVMTYSGIAHLIRHYLFAEMLKPQLPELIWFHSVSVIVITAAVMISGIIASLYFMYDRTKQSEIP